MEFATGRRSSSGMPYISERQEPPMSALEPPPSSRRQTPTTLSASQPAMAYVQPSQHYDRQVYNIHPESSERSRAPPHQPRPSYPVFLPEPDSEPSKPEHRRSQSFTHPRSTPTSSSHASANGKTITTMASTSRADASVSDLPPLSLSILGVEPLDEFIKEIADFVHHMIVTRPEHLEGLVEVEAKVGVLREPRSGARIHVPVLVESGELHPINLVDKTLKKAT